MVELRERKKTRNSSSGSEAPQQNARSRSMQEESPAAALGAIQALPIECILMVLHCLDPPDLLRVARVCKWTRSIVLSKRMGKPIWEHTMQESKMPTVPDDISIPRWIALCCEPWCTSCHMNAAYQISWAFRSRLCDRCAKRDVIHLNQYREVDGSIIENAKMELLSEMVRMPAWSHSEYSIRYPHLKSQASAGAAWGNFRFAGSEYRVLKSELDEVFHLLDHHDYSEMDGLSDYMYNYGYKLAHPEVAAALKRKEDQLDEARRFKVERNVWTRNFNHNGYAEVLSARKQQIIAKLEQGDVRVDALPMDYWSHPIFGEESRLDTTKWARIETKLDEHLNMLRKGEQAEAIWQDWVENQLPTFVASSDYIEDTTLPVLASDGVSFPAIMRLVQAELGNIPSGDDWAAALDTLYEGVADWRADIRTTLCDIIPEKYRLEGAVHPLDRATCIFGIRSRLKIATKRKKSTNLPDKTWATIASDQNEKKGNSLNGFTYAEMPEQLRLNTVRAEDHLTIRGFISLDLDRFAFDTLRSSALQAILALGDIDAAETSLEEIRALGKRWMRMSSTGPCLYSFDELRCFKDLPFGLGDLSWYTPDSVEVPSD